MSTTSRILSGLQSLFGARKRRTAVPIDDVLDPRMSESPGRSGAYATLEIDPGAVKNVRMSYSPVTDGDPDPGEIVWTWVPFEERDGRGKDRPVLVVAAENGGTVLVVQLTSKDHDGDRNDFVPIGSGPWDSQSRESWVNIDRVFRVHPSGMRREAAALEAAPFADVASALCRRFGWE